MDLAKSLLNMIFNRSDMNSGLELNVGESLRQTVQSDEFRANMKTVAPTFMTSMVAWPAFWIYRGFEWHNYRGKETLPAYIQKTYFRAKLLEIMILSLGILVSASTITPKDSDHIAKKENWGKF